jgi:hypothetical protein
MSASPFQIPAGEPPRPDLSRKIHELYGLVLTALTALLILALGINLFFLKQFLTARAELATAQTMVENLSAQYRQKEPAMRQFAAALQNFAGAHPDFQPTLQRYRRALPGFFVERAGSATHRPVFSLTNSPNSPKR